MRKRIVSSMSIAIAAVGVASCGADSGSDEEIATTTAAVVFGPASSPANRYGYSWKWGQLHKAMTGTAWSVCFLSALEGLFTSAQDSVFIQGIAPGAWDIDGTRGNGAPGGSSYCINAVPGGGAGTYDPTEYRWDQGSGSTDLGPELARTCFLTRVKGRLSGSNNWVKIGISNRRWYLTGNGAASGDGVGAGARCINTFTPGVYSWTYDQGRLTPLPVVSGQHWILSSTTSGPACALTRVGGNFLTRTSTDNNRLSVRLEELTPTSWAWHLGGDTRTNRFTSARCVL